MKKANPPLHAEVSLSRINDASGHAQRVRLREHLGLAGSINTIEARSELNIMMPAARIKELREAGLPIKTQRITMTDEHGRTHHGVAQYFLSTEADSDKESDE